MITLIFLLLAAILFALAMFNVPSPRFSLIAAGLFAFTLAYLLPMLHL